MYKRKPYNPKRFEWKFYQINNNLFFFQIYNQGPTLRTAPVALRDLFAHEGPVGHTHYSGSKEGYITSYLLKTSEKDLRRITEDNGRIFKLRFVDNSTRDFGPVTDFEFNIFSRYAGLSDLKNYFISMIRDDVTEFCHYNSAEEFSNKKKHYKLVRKIEPNPRFTLIKPKENELVKAGKGFFDTGCIIFIGMDFSRGCVSNITPDGWYDLEGRCGYCYAYQNGPSFLETLYDFDKNYFIDKFEERRSKLNLEGPIHVRIGQTTEANVPEPIRSFPGFRDNLKIALDALIYLSEKYRLSIAMPTKIPDFDKESIELLKRLDISILASIGYRELERGIVRLGYSPERRLENILELGKMGLNANIYVVTNITDHRLMQEDAKMAIEFFKKHKKYLGLQFLDIRITNKRTAATIGGAPWSHLVHSSQQDFFLESGKWGRTGQNYLHALITDPYFLDLIGDNKGKIRLCSTHVVEDERRCGQCFMDNTSE